MKIRIFFSALLIAAGLGVMAYPYIKSFYFEWQKEQLMEIWLNAPNEPFEPFSENELLPGEQMAYGAGPEAIARSPAQRQSHQQPASQQSAPVRTIDNMEGILYIDSINLQSPILLGATERNLNLAICRLDGAPEAGAYGNYCLSGHKSRLYGRQFNRLNEIASGDIIKVQTSDTVYTYIATETFIVAAEDIWVLESDTSKQEITLITCDYSRKPIARFIVKGVLEESL